MESPAPLPVASAAMSESPPSSIVPADGALFDADEIKQHYQQGLDALNGELKMGVEALSAGAEDLVVTNLATAVGLFLSVGVASLSAQMTLSAVSSRLRLQKAAVPLFRNDKLYRKFLKRLRIAVTTRSRLDLADESDKIDEDVRTELRAEIGRMFRAMYTYKCRACMRYVSSAPSLHAHMSHSNFCVSLQGTWRSK
jgi:hypothetical protein